MYQLRFLFASDTDAVSLSRELPYDNLDWEWEIENGVPLPPGTIAVSRTAVRLVDAGPRRDGASQIGTSFNGR